VDGFAGRRVRLSAFVKSAGVEHRAGVRFRVNGAWGPIFVDDMRGRPIKGTTDWKQYAAVLDVPTHAKSMTFGLLLSGKGRVWMDDVRFEVVGHEVALTAPVSTNAKWKIGYALRGVMGDEKRMMVIRIVLILGGIVTAAGWVVALVRPSRTIPDRIARTRLMMP
jgi:hypothetical protein